MVYGGGIYAPAVAASGDKLPLADALGEEGSASAKAAGGVRLFAEVSQRVAIVGAVGTIQRLGVLGSDE